MDVAFGDRRRLTTAITITIVILAACWFVGGPPAAFAAVSTHTTGERADASPGDGESSLEAAAAKAGNTGRAVAMSLIGLAFAVAATVLAFRRDFKEAAGVFAVGIVSVLLATPAGISLLRDTVGSLFGTQ
ncbi:MAG TPA: hypothetical protein VGI52_01030 [Solirubrobacteraceae bacterium]|jgi:hypothetical protein